MATMPDPIIIVGAGQAGLQIAEALRAEGYDGPLLLLGDEAHPPYHRPPLSKDFLAGRVDDGQLLIRNAEVLARKGIAFSAGSTVTAIDRPARRLLLADGRHLAYGGLALATGARLRRLAIDGAQLRGVLGLRGLDDARRLKAALAAADRVVVIGGGFIGLEVAATARQLGKAVTVAESLDRLMARAVTPPLSEFFAALHRARGVDLRLGCQITRLTGADGRVTGVVTADGEVVPADLVVFGIGILPNAEQAAACGLACDGGIVVDACGRTSDPAIVAAGDCTARRLADGRLLRLESVQNAVEQGRAAAAALLGRDRPFAASPWFWSDQYEVKLQMAGLSAGHDQMVLRGVPEQAAFSIFYYRAGVLLAVDSVNRPQDPIAARKLLDKGRSPSPEQAADPDFALVSLLS